MAGLERDKPAEPVTFYVCIRGPCFNRHPCNPERTCIPGNPAYLEFTGRSSPSLGSCRKGPADTPQQGLSLLQRARVVRGRYRFFFFPKMSFQLSL
jgi:hypothetical protein